VLAELSGGKHGAKHRFEPIVVALPFAADIPLLRRFARFLVHTRRFVVGVALARCGPLGQHRVKRRAGFGIQQSSDRTHAVGLLPPDDQMTLPRAVDVVGFFAVLVEQGHEPIGGRPQLFRPELAGDATQGGFRLFAGAVVDPAR
jgi:hypothetical protein